MNKVTKNFLLGTALAGTFVVTGAVDFTLGGELNTTYGFRSGTLNLEGEKYSDRGLAYLATENTIDTATDAFTVDNVTETGVASSALTAEAMVDIDVKAGDKDLSYGVSVTLEGSTSDAKTGSSAAARKAFVYGKTKYGMLSFGSMESCTAMLRENMINAPYAGTGDSHYWIPEYVGKSTVTVGAEETVDGEKIVDNIMPSVFFMLEPGLYGGNIAYTDEVDHFGAGAPDRDVRYKMVYGNRVSYKSPAWKGVKLGISYLPYARTGTVSSLTSSASADTTVQKKRLKNLWDVSLSYKHELKNGAGFMGYLAYETGNMVDHMLGFGTTYYVANTTSSTGVGEYSPASLKLDEATNTLSFSTPRNLKAYELGLCMNYKGFTLTGGAGNLGKELVGTLDVSTIKDEASALKTLAAQVLKDVELKAYNADTRAALPLITLKALDSSGEPLYVVIRRSGHNYSAMPATQRATGVLGFEGDGASVQHIAIADSSFDQLASFLDAPGISGSANTLKSSVLTFSGTNGVVEGAAGELSSFTKDKDVGAAGLPKLHELARGVDALVYLSKLGDTDLVAGHDGSFGATPAAGSATKDNAPISADTSKERFKDSVLPALEHLLTSLKYDSTVSTVDAGKHKVDGLLAILTRAKGLAEGSQDVYKAWNGSRHAAKYYHIGLHYKRGCFAASARYQNTERTMFGAAKANKMSKVELAASYKVAPGLLGYVEGSMYDLDYRTASSRYIGDLSKAEDQKNKVKTILIGGRLKF